MKAVKGILTVLILALSLMLPAASGRAQGLATAGQDEGAGTALIAVFLDEPARWTQAQQAGLVLYGLQPSGQGDYLLAGAALDAGGRLPEFSFPVRLLDADPSAASYYLVYPRRATMPRPWSAYGRVLLELADQVLLRASAEQVAPLVDAGAEIVKIWLQPQPWPAEPAEPATPLAITPSADVQAMLDQVSTSTISQYTAQLSGEQIVTVDDAPYTIISRYTYSGTPIQKAGRFVGEHLASLEMTPEYHVWGSSGTPATYPNVIGQITGGANPGSIYMIGAHLDDVPSSGFAPGADDNGSGAVGTLIAADILAQYKWNCTLRFAFWTGEEQGLLGSAAYATRARNAGENILGYLNMDMIAFNSGAPNEINLFANSSVAGSVAMRDLYADAISAYGLNLTPVKYTNDSLGNQSDNKSFWDRGYPSMLAIEDYYGDFNTRYHTNGDRLAYLDMAYYTAFVRASLATFVHLSGCLAPDFRVAAAPASLNVCAPADATTAIGVSSVAGFASPVTLSASGLPAGATAAFSANPVNPGGSSVLTIGNTGAAAAGAYDITVTGASAALTQAKTVTLNLAHSQPAAAALTGPADGSTAVAAAPTFTWNAAAGAASYTLQVATDPAFSSLVIDQSGLTGASYTPDSALAFDAVYYWRVAAVNSCGSQVSAARAFRTAATGCVTYASADAPKYITASSGVVSTLSAAATFPINDVNVEIGEIVHTSDADLDIYIRHPDLTEIALSTDNGSTGDNYANTVFNDEAAAAITTGAAPFTGSYRPETLLSAFDGKSSTGANPWRLRVVDDTSSYNGALNAWRLTLCGGSAAAAADYSDLAGSYGVAWHTGNGSVRLGSGWDADDSFYAGYDDARSDGGVTRDYTESWDDLSGEVRVTVNGAAGEHACLNAWLDYSNGDAVTDMPETPNGVFDANEHVVVNQVMSPGADQLVAWPLARGVINSGAQYNMRFRLTPDPNNDGNCGDVTLAAADALPGAAGLLAPDGGGAITGGAAGGEVEDYIFASGPLAVELAAFTAAAAPEGVALAWETVSEIDNAGFNVYRADSDAGPWIKLNDALIPATAPGSSEGHAYTWTDATAEPGKTYWYMLEDVALDGAATRHAPVAVTLNPGEPNALGLAGFGATILPRITRIGRIMVVVGLAALALAATRRRLNV